jgi:CRP-like cAMP-binding protein
MKELHLLSQGAFASLTREQLAQLVKVGSWRTLEPGTQVTREGEPVKDLVLICDGQMVVESQGRTITHLHGGSLVGELAFVSGNAASATVTAQRVTRAFVLEMEKLRKVVRVDDLVASAVDRVVGRDLAAKLQASTEYSLSSS